MKVEVGAPISSGPGEVLQLDGRRCRSLGAFLHEVGLVLHFPPYYGENWDAFEECINDLDWWPETAITLVVEHTEQLLADESPRQLAILVDILLAESGTQRALTLRFDDVSDSRIAKAFAPLLR
ncbi:barstar family protein [Curtobacterium poinsettiae]|uniref:Barstar family protein n=1 Tax=Curtobacterium poinsettiae TaxID=159612 RepID=A0ABT3S1A0_9MICO|nr:barstar family protein [Curtobacterium flaccumfaciens]MBT1609755.1 barstar family protein [Curtobacterium flaccumfaciens pv. poinsettiae]MCX2848615.1 barstar family protein [Curtobacterium flaccumfaciens pv. poinsettiae]UXN19197.1 barstar family protein [Curtobacterium flaccumfaciens pv. poinsettiae]